MYLNSLQDKSEVVSNSNSNLLGNKIKEEINNFIIFDITPLRTDSSSDSKYNALEFYKLYVNQFPLLANVAKQYLSLTATSVPAESLFSVMGIIVDEQRNRLHPSVLDTISLIKNNSII